MSLSKKTRFEVFKRDAFKCGYCGGTPPMAILEVDHIEPKSCGGVDDMVNLITACFDCNRGKGARSLDKIPESMSTDLKILQERETQAREYHIYLHDHQQRVDYEIKKVFDLLCEAGEQGGIYELGHKEKLSIKTFLKKLSYLEVLEAAEIAVSKKHTPWYAFKYFCGICWKKIKAPKVNE